MLFCILCTLFFVGAPRPTTRKKSQKRVNLSSPRRSVIVFSGFGMFSEVLVVDCVFVLLSREDDEAVTFLDDTDTLESERRKGLCANLLSFNFNTIVDARFRRAFFLFKLDRTEMYLCGFFGHESYNFFGVRLITTYQLLTFVVSGAPLRITAEYKSSFLNTRRKVRGSLNASQEKYE